MSGPFWRQVAAGLRSFIVALPTGTGGTTSARYCYSVYLRHRIMAERDGLSGTPERVVELGPGDSLGIGLMALLTGSHHYTAVDVVQHASCETNLAIFDKLVALLGSRASIPADGECAEIRPALDSYDFPHKILTAKVLAHSLAPERVAAIRQSLAGVAGGDGALISYRAPFGELKGLEPENIDWLFSQAVLEHVDRPAETYAQCFRCLKPGGYMTHQVDYRCHETASRWNGHLQYPDWLWKLMRGRRPWFVNRHLHSEHRQMQRAAGFRIVSEMLQTQPGEVEPARLARRFRSMSSEDLHACGGFLVSVKGHR